MYKRLASIGIPKSMHCLSLRLAEEYTLNALARLPLPSPELVSILTNTSYHHVALLTDNVLAASVAVTSIVRSSSQPEKMVIHVITDKKTYAPMHAWFALNPVGSVVVEVKGLHQFDWPNHVNMGVMEMKEIHRLIRGHYFYYYEGDHGRLEAMRPNHLSLLNYLRIYLPELFPELDRIVFLDDDVVVRRDLSPLWALNLDGKVNGAVSSREGNRERGDCLGGRYGDYFNFSNPNISSKFDSDSCAWLYGLNLFDLNEWRRSNITQTYHRWLKLNLDSGFTLWHLGALPPALAAFHGHVQPIDPSWHVSGLGHQSSERDRKMVEAAAVIHFSGPAKPWLQIGFPELRRYWAVNVNFSNEYIRACNIE